MRPHPGLALLVAPLALATAFAKDPPATLYRPRPDAEWAADVAPTGSLSLVTIGPVVVVVVRHAYRPNEPCPGSGLVVRGGEATAAHGAEAPRPALVLTCAHVVRRALEVRVGTFAYSYAPRAEGTYRETPATIVAEDRELDLALLEVPAHGLRPYLPRGLPKRGSYTVVSVVPFGRPVVQDQGPRPKFAGGQSGSPILDGDLVGLVKGFSNEVPTWVPTASIEAFLRDAPGGMAIVATWEAARQKAAAGADSSRPARR